MKAKAKNADKRNKKKQAPKKQKYNPHRQPEKMTTEEWQRALREQTAQRENLVVDPVYNGREGYFKVTNPLTNRVYSVVYRGATSSWNYCSCPDFRTNQLGTCKHIEAVGLAADGKYARKRYIIPDCTTVYLDYRGPRKIKIRIGGEKAEEIRTIATRYFDEEQTLKEECFDSFGSFLTEAREVDPTTRCFDDALDFIIEKRERVVRQHIADDSPNMTEGLLKVPLYPYQRQGVEFAFRQGHTIIADEMGLGKTIQAIGAAMALKKHGFVQSVWIICPTSLKYQWKNEIEKFTDETVLVIEGNVIQRAKFLVDSPEFFKIISYHSMVNTVKFGLKRMPDMIIYDEVQRLKNWDTKMGREMRQLKSNYVVALSGTPLENKLTELYSVMQLVDQYILGPYWKFVNETTQKDATGRVTGYHNLNQIGETLKSVLLRRKKSQVKLQMPSRIDKNLFVPVTKEQMAIHNDCKWNVGILLSRWKKLGFLSEKDRMRLMLLLSTMRMVADSTFIIDQKTRHDTKIDEAINIITDVIESGDEKIVIFSQWERMQRILSQELEARGIGFRFLHGGVPSKKRGALIDDFMNNPDCRVFLSTDAGSTGLNLQAASIVINLDLPWNPAVLEQRIARAYRLGQQRQVQVINMVSVGTIEENMLTTLAFKTGLFEGVLDGGDDAVVLNDQKFKHIAEILDSGMEFDDAKPSDESSEVTEDETGLDKTETEVEEEQYEELAENDDYTPEEKTEPEEEEEDYSDDESSEEDEDESEEPWERPYDDYYYDNGYYDEDDEYDEYDEDNDDEAEEDGEDVESTPSTDRPASSDDTSAGDTDTSSDGNSQSSRGSSSSSNDGPALISKGIELLGSIATALSTPESRDRLVDSLVKEDPATGQKSISIPVADKETVANILTMVAGFFSSLKK